MWTFLMKLIDYLFRDVSDKLDIIVLNQHSMREQLMAIKETLEGHVAKVNAFSDQLAVNIELIKSSTDGIRQDILDLKAQLPGITPAEVEALVNPIDEKLALQSASLQAQADALKALDDENVPVVPPPPVEPTI